MSPPRILFVALSNDVSSERMVIEAGRHGAACAVLAPPRAYAALPRCVAAVFAMPDRFGSLGAHLCFAGRFRKAIAAWAPDWLVPLDELSAVLIRALGLDPHTSDDLRNLVERSLGPASGFHAACERVALMEAARRVGVRTPAFASADGSRNTPDLTSPPAFPLMVKRDQSSGSGGVDRVETSAELAVALRRARLKTAAKTRLARLGGLRRRVTPVLLQSVVEGRLAMFSAACRAGRMVDGIGFEAVEVHPTKKASTVLRRIAHPEMREAAGKLVATLGCSGFVSFDFLLDGADRAFLIEMNPRPIGSTHLGRRFGHDLVGAFLSGATAPATPTLAADVRIALFPKELERDPDSRYLALDPCILFDVPEGEPAVVAAYMAHLKALHPGHATEFDDFTRSMTIRMRRAVTAAGLEVGPLPLAS